MLIVVHDGKRVIAHYEGSHFLEGGGREGTKIWGQNPGATETKRRRFLNARTPTLPHR
jgi:hypothetical protein